MSEFDFDKLKNIEIPDKWVEGALNVPKKPPVISIFMKKVLPVAASLVLVIMLSFFVIYITTVDEIKTAPKKDVHSSSSVNLIVDNTAYTNSDETDLTEGITDNGEIPTQKPTDAEKQTNTPQQSPTQLPVNQGEKPTTSPVVKPSTSPEKPTVTPTDPSDPNTPSNPQGKPDDGNTVEPEAPTPDIPARPNGSVILIAEFDESLLKGSNNVYVSIKKLNTGDLDVEGDMWEEEQPKYSVHTVSVENFKVMVAFYPTIAGVVHESGDYVCTFYNHKGEVVYFYVEYIDI